MSLSWKSGGIYLFGASIGGLGMAMMPVYHALNRNEFSHRSGMLGAIVRTIPSLLLLLLFAGLLRHMNIEQERANHVSNSPEQAIHSFLQTLPEERRIFSNVVLEDRWRHPRSPEEEIVSYLVSWSDGYGLRVMFSSAFADGKWTLAASESFGRNSTHPSIAPRWGTAVETRIADHEERTSPTLPSDESSKP
jgi:hypothetical protein